MDILFGIFEAQSVLFLLVGLIFTGIGGGMLFYAYNFRKHARRAAGTLVGFQKEAGSKGTPYYYPLVEFTPPGASEAVRFRGSVGSNVASEKKIGRPVKVLFSPSNPEDAHIDGPSHYIFGAILLAIGLGMGVFYFLTFEFTWFSLAWLLLIGGYGAAKLLGVLKKIPAVATAPTLGGAFRAALAEARSKKDVLKRSQNIKKETEIISSATAMRAAKRRAAKKTPAWIFLLFACVGAGLAAGAGFTAKNRADFLATALSTQGTILRFEQHSSTSDGHTTYTYHPVIRFTLNETSYTFEDDTGSSHPSRKRGDVVPVLYTPHNPGEAIMDKGLGNWFGPLLLGAMGLVFGFVGVYGWRHHKNTLKN